MNTPMTHFLCAMTSMNTEKKNTTLISCSLDSFSNCVLSDSTGYETCEIRHKIAMVSSKNFLRCLFLYQFYQSACWLMVNIQFTSESFRMHRIYQCAFYWVNFGRVTVSQNPQNIANFSTLTLYHSALLVSGIPACLENG